MKKLLSIAILTIATIVAKAQVTPFDVAGTNILSQIDESISLFSPSEIEVRLGGVYVQQTGEAGTLIAVEKWDVGIANLGIGAETIQSAQRQAAEFVYVGYRKVFGNTSGALFLGGGYDQINSCPLGVVGARLEHRFNKHYGIWTSVSYGLETKQSNSRGTICGGGVSYSF